MGAIPITRSQTIFAYGMNELKETRKRKGFQCGQMSGTIQPERTTNSEFILRRIELESGDLVFTWRVREEVVFGMRMRYAATKNGL